MLTASKTNFMKSTPFLLLICIAAVQVVTCDASGGSKGVLGLDIFEDLDSLDDPGYELIDASAFVSARRNSIRSGSAGPSSPDGRPGAPAPPPKFTSVDMCFLVDITGSMMPYITAVKKTIRDSVNFLTKEARAVGTVRLCFVGYRDFKDDRHIETLPFTTDVTRFFAFVEKLVATGGMDMPEDVFTGLEKVGRQDWKAQRRAVLHIADAPCHGHGCGGGTRDPKRRDVDNVFSAIRSKKVKYRFGRIRSSTDTMMKLFREAYGHKIKLFDVSLPPGSPGAPGIDGTRGAPGPPRYDLLEKKVGDASIAAVLLDD